MYPERQVSGSPVQRPAFGRISDSGFLCNTEPDRLDMAASGVLCRYRVAKGNGVDKVLVLVNQNAHIRKVVFKTLLVEIQQPLPDEAPCCVKSGNPGHFYQRFMEPKVCFPKGGVVRPSERAGEILQSPPKRVETPGRLLGVLRSMTGGETLQQRTEFRKSAKLGTGHKN